MNNQAKYFHAFNLIDDFGPKSFQKLLDFFGSLEIAWQKDIDDLRKSGIRENLIEKIALKRKKINPDQEFEKVIEKNIEIVTVLDPNYPRLLKEIYNPPALLYIKGQFKEEDEFSLAVVGTRKISTYGQQVTPKSYKNFL